MSNELEFHRTKGYLILNVAIGVAAVAFLLFISFNMLPDGGAFPWPVPLGLCAFAAYIVYRIVRAVKELREKQVYLRLDATGASVKGKLKVEWRSVRHASIVTETRNGAATSCNLRLKKVDGSRTDVSIAGIGIDHEDMLATVGRYISVYGASPAGIPSAPRRPAPAAAVLSPEG